MNDQQIEKYAKAQADLAEALATIRSIDSYARTSGFGAWRHTIVGMTNPILSKNKGTSK